MKFLNPPCEADKLLVGAHCAMTSPRAENSNGASPATVLEGFATKVAQLQVRGWFHLVYLNEILFILEI